MTTDSSTPSRASIDFPTVLASSVHDMKNSLCLVIQSIENLLVELQHTAQAETLSKLHYEAQRINMSLVQLLALYREQQDILPLNIELHYVQELVDEIVVSQELYVQQRGITITTNIDNSLTCFADRELVGALLNDILVNAMRYAADSIIIQAATVADGVQLTISDNGPGYPNSMLAAADAPMAQLDLLQARTGLGLYFANLIAQQHQRNERSGYISLSNGGALGGSVFTLTLP